MKRNSALSNCACSPKIEFACPEVTDFSFLCIFHFYCFSFFIFSEKKKQKKQLKKKKNEENSALSNCACSPRLSLPALKSLTSHFLCIFLFYCFSFFFFIFSEKTKKQKKNRKKEGWRELCSVQLCLLPKIGSAWPEVTDFSFLCIFLLFFFFSFFFWNKTKRRELCLCPTVPALKPLTSHPCKSLLTFFPFQNKHQRNLLHLNFACPEVPLLPPIPSQKERKKGKLRSMSNYTYSFFIGRPYLHWARQSVINPPKTVKTCPEWWNVLHPQDSSSPTIMTFFNPFCFFFKK